MLNICRTPLIENISGQGYLFQESQQSGWTAFYFVGWQSNRHW